MSDRAKKALDDLAEQAQELGMGYGPPYRFCTRLCNYFATGEGHTFAAVIAPTPAAAERIFIKEFGEYFNGGAEDFDCAPPAEYLPHIPAKVLEMAAKVPWFVYHGKWHFNLS